MNPSYKTLTSRWYSTPLRRYATPLRDTSQRCAKKMKTHLFVLIVVFCLLSGCSDRKEKENSSSRISSQILESTLKSDFYRLKKAIKEGDGTTASGLVSDETIQLYEDCRVLAISTESVDFSQVDQVRVLLTFQLRYLLDRKSLDSMTGRDIFSWGIKKRMTQKDILEQIDIHKVQFEGSEAFASITKANIPDPQTLFRFKQDDGVWKLRMEDMLLASNAKLDAVRKSAGKTKVELAIYLLERTYGTQISPTIIDEPLKHKSGSEGH